MFIYKITNRLDGKFYVGQTIKPITYRFRKHCETALRGEGYKLHAAVRKHGKENFYVELLEECETLEQLNERETHFITTLNPPYNLCVAPCFRLGAESIKKMSASLRGKKHPPEVVKKRAASVKSYWDNNPEALVERGKKISKGKLKPVVVEGVTYLGVQEVADAYEISYKAAQARLSSKNARWVKGDNSKQCHPLTADGVLYESTQDAAEAHQISVHAARHRIRSNNFPSWKRV